MPDQIFKLGWRPSLYDLNIMDGCPKNQYLDIVFSRGIMGWEVSAPGAKRQYFNKPKDALRYIYTLADVPRVTFNLSTGVTSRMGFFVKGMDRFSVATGLRVDYYTGI